MLVTVFVPVRAFYAERQLAFEMCVFSIQCFDRTFVNSLGFVALIVFLSLHFLKSSNSKLTAVNHK